MDSESCFALGQPAAEDYRSILDLRDFFQSRGVSVQSNWRRSGEFAVRDAEGELRYPDLIVAGGDTESGPVAIVNFEPAVSPQRMDEWRAFASATDLSGRRLNLHIG